MNEQSTPNFESKISYLLGTLGFSKNQKGYVYWREAIKKAVNDFSIVKRMTKELYPSIAKQFNDTASRAERALRHSIDTLWTKDNIHRINDTFGSVYTINKKPCVSDLLATIADGLKQGIA